MKQTNMIALFVLVLSLSSCSIPGITIQIGPTPVPPTPTATPTPIPPTPIPTPVRLSFTQILSNMGFQPFSNGYKYESGNAVVLVDVGITGFSIYIPLGSGYDTRSDSTVIGILLAQLIYNGYIPYDVGAWASTNIVNAPNNVTYSSGGYSCEDTVVDNSGILSVEIVVSWP